MAVDNHTGKYTGTLATFSSELNYSDISAAAIYETKRGLLDTIGCALGGITIDKGRMGIECARRVGGRPESTIIGSNEKIAAPMAAFANGELAHALDYTALLPPGHVAPFVIPAVLALAEVRKSSGKEFTTAVVVAHEIASRIGDALGAFRTPTGEPLKSHGFGSNIFGAAAGAGKIMKLDAFKMANALGIAGYFAPIPSHQKFVVTPYNGLQKYGPAGWIAQGGVTAATLAEIGEHGDRQILEGEFGFWTMNGSPVCNWDAMINNLGKNWFLLQAKYKSFPACGTMQSPLGVFIQVINNNDIKTDEIEQVIVRSDPRGGSPQFMKTEIHDHCDGQNSLFYNIAVAAHRIKVGPQWQVQSTVENPSILSFMKKVKWEPYPRAAEMVYQELEVEKRTYLNRRPSYVEIHARGQVFSGQTDYARWISADTPEFRATDKDLKEKFKSNAENVLSKAKMEAVIDTIMNLEKVHDINDLIKLLAPDVV